MRAVTVEQSCNVSHGNLPLSLSPANSLKQNTNMTRKQTIPRIILLIMSCKLLNIKTCFATFRK